MICRIVNKRKIETQRMHIYFDIFSFHFCFFPSISFLLWFSFLAQLNHQFSILLACIHEKASLIGGNIQRTSADHFICFLFCRSFSFFVLNFIHSSYSPINVTLCRKLFNQINNTLLTLLSRRQRWWRWHQFFITTTIILFFLLSHCRAVSPSITRPCFSS